MKTNTFNFFRNAFAIVGFFIIACSVGTADDTTVEPEPPVQSNIGKYQIAIGQSLSSSNGSAYRNLVVLNTETGVMKTYGVGNSGWVENQNLPTITFTH
tara:strand:+ start:179 stop:475 length:297 start_codon:yes stop_codon:yes gene_type:complete